MNTLYAVVHKKPLVRASVGELVWLDYLSNGDHESKPSPVYGFGEIEAIEGTTVRGLRIPSKYPFSCSFSDMQEVSLFNIDSFEGAQRHIDFQCLKAIYTASDFFIAEHAALENQNDDEIHTTDPADDPVNHPAHYTNHPSGIECIEITKHMGFCLGNAIKYIWRADLKHDTPIEDLKKALWYIQCEIDKRENQA